MGREAFSALLLSALQGRAFHATGECRYDHLRNLVLNSEDVGQVAVIALGPQVTGVHAVDQLRGDADLVARLLHAALNNIAHAQLTAHVLGLRRLAFVVER